MAKILTGITLLALLALQPGLSHAQVIDGIAAVVNEEVITSFELDKEYQLMQKEQEKLPPSEKMGLRSAALNRLVDKKLIDQKVRELDIKVMDEEVKLAIDDVKKQNNMTQEALVQALAGQGLTFEQYRTQLKEQLERLRLMSQEVRSKIQVGEQEIREYYEANRAKYGAVEQFRARHIFFKIDKKGGGGGTGAGGGGGRRRAEAGARREGFRRIGQDLLQRPGCGQGRRRPRDLQEGGHAAGDWRQRGRHEARRGERAGLESGRSAHHKA